ncbi:MAG TPA: radical SAM protein [Firmicutes bacterium]|nr:radical SAM protein [Bacillota bacterium]
MALKHSLQAAAVRESLRYVGRNPGENIGKLVNLLKPFARVPEHREILCQVEEVWQDPENNWRRMTERAFAQLSPGVMEKFVTSFLLNAALIGVQRRQEMEEELQCNVPWAILMDPTSDCNLRCKGCWAEEYERGGHLSLEELDSIITQGKELGIYFYLYSGGEPLLRADDILKLARKHQDCIFCAFTNATLVTPELAQELADAGNIMLAISVEGFADDNDFRRGKGSYAHVVRAMDLLRDAGAPFGFSACYHRYNTEEVASEQFIDAMIDKGAFFGWFFTYIPLGRNAQPGLLVTPEQRKLMYAKVREYRASKDIFVLDFWNDGEYVNGCIAGGRRYLHINAHGDVEPCAFIHYSNVNIRDVSLIEALTSPLFMQYRERHPFNPNHLRPCPLLDNPDELVAMVKTAGAYSTQRRDNEDAEALAEKCREAADQWGEVADQLWNGRHAEKTEQAVS